ncbi:MAG TPA: sulfatase-like hydrolase/transferase [Oligoflexia bacterium]|nr:sulfatase-like hydrolase/transferase [Oligoflexia bacterium]HMP49858.1 sulfatase-like hydrolase/transferase [Oligoflexia bacterium]
MKNAYFNNKIFLCYLLFLQSFGTILYLYPDKGISSLGRGSWIVLGSASCILFLFQITIVFLGECLLILPDKFIPGIFSSSISKTLKTLLFSVLTLAIPVFLLLDDLHYKFMGFRLNASQVVLLADGAVSDMSPLNKSHVLSFILFFAVWNLLLVITSKISFKSGKIVSVYVPKFLFAFFCFILLIDSALGSIDQEGFELKESLYWNDILKAKNTNIPHQGFLGQVSLSEENSSRAAKVKIEKSNFLLKSFESEVNSEKITKPNILFLVVESLRSDMFSETFMPELYKRKNEFLVLDNHFSSGANSGSGDFGLITGLNTFHFKDHKIQKTVPFPFQVLKKLGYELSIYFTNSMRYENIYDIFFEPIFDRTISPDELPQPSWDASLVKKYTEELKSRTSRNPWFHFLRLYVTHYGFYYPPEFEFHTPTVGTDIRLEPGPQRQLQKHKEGLKNRYLNSVRYADYLISSIVKELEDTGTLENTILVILGDHGEEFWEKGKFGHVFDLTREQIQTTALIRFPESIKRNFKYNGGISSETQNFFIKSAYQSTSHSDVFPTIFHSMKVDFLLDSSVFDGRSLLSYDENRDWITASTGLVRLRAPKNHIIVGKNLKIYFSNKTDDIVIDKVTNLDDILLKDFSRKDVKNLLHEFRKSLN